MRWIDTVFQFSQNVVLGAYQNGKLGAVSVSQLVGETLFYSTFFCRDECLPLFVSDLMLHHVRAAAVDCDAVRQIFVGLRKNEPGLNEFYLQRGGQLVQRPAVLTLNPVTGVLLRLFMRETYARLAGCVTHPDGIGGDGAEASQPGLT